MTRASIATVAWLVATTCACTVHHSKQALSSSSHAVATPNAKFVTEEDSGLMLLGAFTLAEPDHYAVLLERARRRFHCAQMHHAQLDFFTEHWLIVAFPVSRMTLVCEPAPVAQVTP